MAHISSAARRAAQDSMQRLARDLGSESLIVPFRETESRGPKGAPAYTSADGVFIWKGVLEEEPENLHVYVAHEIGHHAIGNAEATVGFSHDVVNVAEDLKINQYNLQCFGYDVRRVVNRGLLDSHFDEMSVRQACSVVASGSLAALGCGCRSMPHASIFAAARAMRKRWGLRGREPMVCDEVDMRAFESVANHAVFARATSIPMDVPTLVTGLWAHCYQPRPVATKRSGRLTNTQAIAYAFPGERFRGVVAGREVEAVVVARRYLRAVDGDKRRVEGMRAKVSREIEMAQIKLVKARGARAKGLATTSEVRAARRLVVRKMWLLRKWQARRTIPDLLATEPVFAVGGTHGPAHTLRTSELDASDMAAPDVPRLRSPETLRALRRAASQTLREMEEAVKLLTKITKVTGDDLSDMPAGGEGTKEGGTAGNGGGPGNEDSRRAQTYDLVERHGVDLERVLFFTQHFLSALSNPKTRRTTEDPDRPASVFAFGSDVDALDASEMAMLLDEQTRVQFFLRFSDDALLQYSPPDQKRSPVAICVDGSGSMRGIPYAMAAGFAVAMVKLLANDGRESAVIGFDTNVRRVIAKARSRADYLKVLDLLLSPTMGGTNFDLPMRVAQDTRDLRKWPSMTTIFISDGQCALMDPAAYESRKKRGDHVVGVLVGRSAASVDFADEVLIAERDELSFRLVDLGRRVL